MPIRLEYLAIAEVPQALRDLHAAHVKEREHRVRPPEDPPTLAERVSNGIAWTTAFVRRQPLYQRAQALVRERMTVIGEFTQSVAASQVLGAAWAGVRTHMWLIIVFSAGINLLYLAPSLYMMQVYDRVL